MAIKKSLRQIVHLFNIKMQEVKPVEENYGARDEPDVDKTLQILCAFYCTNKLGDFWK